MRKLFYHVYRFLFAREKLAFLNSFIVRLGLKGLGVLNYETFDASGESFALKYFRGKNNKVHNPIIFDIGANVGIYTENILKLIPGALIYSFEPHPKTFKTLQANIKGASTTLNLAIGNEIGKITIFDKSSDGSEHASLIKEVVNNTEVKATQVDINTIDNFCKENQIESIDFLKIDVEGCEYDVLLGAKEMIGHGKIHMIQFEFGALNIHRKVFFYDFQKLLKNRYDLYRLLPNGLLKFDDGLNYMNEIFGFQNILAVSKR
jgi:FkbM family methyltransferase